MTDKHVQQQIDAGRWQLVAPQVVAADNGRLDADQLLWRAVLHAPTAWVGGRSSLHELGLRGFAPTEVHLLVPRTSRPERLSGVVLHVSDRLDGLDPERGRGLPVTPPPRSVVDGAAWSPHPRLAAGLVLDAIRQGLVTARDVDSELARAGRVRHKVAVRDAIRGALAGAESMAELDIGPLLRAAGITQFRRQVRSGRRRHDVETILADGTILVVEVDGLEHESSQRRWADADRDFSSAADGKITVRVPAYAVRHESARVVERLARIADAARRRSRDR